MVLGHVRARVEETGWSFEHGFLLPIIITVRRAHMRSTDSGTLKMAGQLPTFHRLCQVSEDFTRLFLSG